MLLLHYQRPQKNEKRECGREIIKINECRMGNLKEINDRKGMKRENAAVKSAGSEVMLVVISRKSTTAKE